MVHGHPAASIRVVVEQREVGHPDELVAVGGHESALGRNQLAEVAQRRIGDLGKVGHEEEQVALLRAHGARNLGLPSGVEELGDAARPTLRRQLGPAEPLGAEDGRLGGVLVDALAADVAAVRHHDALDHAALGDRVGKEREGEAVGRQRADVL